MIRSMTVAMAATGLLAAAVAAAGPTLDAAKIEAASGEKATTTPDGVVRLSFPRHDVKVTVDGVALKPFAGLGSWAAFEATPGGAMMMGDTVVFQDEVNPAMEAAFGAGLEVSALHNHFFYDEPKVFFMHIGGHGDAAKLAAGVKAVWGAVRKVRADHAEPATAFGGPAVNPGAVTAGPLAKILDAKADEKDGIVKFTIGREVTMHGAKAGASMGLTTWAAFMGSDDAAAVDGDFIMTAAEIQPVLHALQSGKIAVVALHNHMTGEEPVVYFTHFWGKGPAAELAKTVRAALDAQKGAAKPSH